jgi:xanthine dehydrogenase accessory factor
MNRAVLQSLLQARAERTAVALVTDLAGGAQRIIARSDIARDPLSESLERRFRFDESGVETVDGREYFILVQNPPLRVVVVGAVHIAQVLVPMLRAVPYDVTIVDPRGSFATAERFPETKLHADWPDDVLPALGLDQRTAILLLTHDPKIDDPALVAALRSECFYIGALGSRKTHAKRLERLEATGLREAGKQRVHAPIGLDIGARGAPEIAIAIVAEMTKVLRLGPERK